MKINLRKAVAGGIVAAALGAAGVYTQLTPGVDSYGGLTVEEATQMAAEGVGVYVQPLSAFPVGGLVQPADRIPSLRNAQQAGLQTAGYALVDCDRDGASDMDFARAGVPDDIWDSLLFVAVDVEVSCNRVDEVNTACERLAELGKTPCVVYSSWGAWKGYLGDAPHPPGALLWNAFWDDNPDFDFERFPYGGWTIDEVLGEQFQGSTDLQGNLTMVAGQLVDKNVFRLELLNPPVIQPPPCDCDQADWDDPIPVPGGYVQFNRREQTWYQFGATVWRHLGGDQFECVVFCFPESK